MNLEKSDFKSSISEHHLVCYYLYLSSVDNVDKFGIPINITDRAGKEECIVKNGSNICFATLLPELRRNKEIDRLVYLSAGNSISLTKDEISEWLDLCIKAKVLPDYIKEESDTEQNRYILKIDPSLKPSMLYIHLTSIRWIQEAPVFVRNMIALVNKYHVSFYLAWLVASKMSMGNSWHNIVEDQPDYGQTIYTVLKDSIFDVAVACGIKNLVLHTDKFDKRSIGKMESAISFMAANKVLAAKPSLSYGGMISTKHITNSALNKAIESGTTSDLEDVLTEIRKA